jgi:hypothetical protein
MYLMYFQIDKPTKAEIGTPRILAREMRRMLARKMRCTHVQSGVECAALRATYMDSSIRIYRIYINIYIYTHICVQ